MNSSTYLRFILFALLLVALQVWVLSPIALFRVATPSLYPFVLLLLLVHHVTLYILQAAGMRMGGLHIIISFPSGYAFSWVLAVMTLFFFGTGEGARSK